MLRDGISACGVALVQNGGRDDAARLGSLRWRRAAAAAAGAQGAWREWRADVMPLGVRRSLLAKLSLVRRSEEDGGGYVLAAQARPPQGPFFPRLAVCRVRSERHTPLPGHSIAAVRTLTSSLSRTAGGKGGSLKIGALAQASSPFWERLANGPAAAAVEDAGFARRLGAFRALTLDAENKGGLVFRNDSNTNNTRFLFQYVKTCISLLEPCMLFTDPPLYFAS